ncbi:antirestriction protein [Salmonella enterica]|nr:antirestriction protein [Salmonella enterica]EAR6586421.1 antirestriction protein [Salmonella enterica]EAV1936243.1 antirestriction protein [Salmonella enterica]EBB7504838.1 antirestriction protein [Salmonella enterica]EBE1691402.1 antirestriction protein [Salmonella enterica]
MKNMPNLNGDIAESQSLSQPDAGTIVCTQVPDEQRIAFWPQHFGSIPQWVTLEPQIFAWMDRLCEGYCGGIWNFYTLSNGGAFMAPEAGADSDEKWTLFNPMNGNGTEMSAEAAGMAACLMAYSHHAMRTECDAMTEHYYRLRDYALNHPECSAIMHIID